MAHASGKYAKAISDRSGMEFPYKEMVKEWNGSLVHKSEFEAKHPQLERQKHAADAQSLQDSRPDRLEPTTVFVGGTGSWKRLIGTKCTLAYVEFDEGASHTKIKCNLE